MVSTGRCSAAVAAEAAITAISIPGQPGRTRRSQKISAAEPAPMASASGLRLGAACHSAASLGSSGPGSAPARCRPRKSRIWLAKMVIAMPQVKPTVTACGIWRISEPSRQAPTSVISTPDISTHTSSPFSPNRAVVAATSTMNAPAGPPIW